jgi:hypothetical protein
MEASLICCKARQYYYVHGLGVSAALAFTILGRIVILINVAGGTGFIYWGEMNVHDMGQHSR